MFRDDRSHAAPSAALLLAFALAAAPARGGASGSPSLLAWADQLQVNVTTALQQQDADPEALAAGGWLVVWKDQGLGAVLARTFDRDGTPRTDERTVVEGTVGSPEVARLDDGRFVVVWLSLVESPLHGLVTGVQGRFLTAAGQPVGSVFTVQTLSLPPRSADVAAADAGGFIVAWTSSDTSDVFVRRFGPTASPLEEAVPASSISGVQSDVNLCRLRGGRGHVLVWSSDTSTGGDGSGSSVQWRRLGPDGAFPAPEAQANDFVLGDQYRAKVAPTSDGGFAVTWESDPGPGLDLEAASVGAGNGIVLRLFDADGSPLAPEETLSENDGASTAFPTIATAPGGDLLVAWTLLGEILRSARHAPWPAGAIGAELRVDDFDAAVDLRHSRAVFDGNGDAAIVWQSAGASPGGDGSSTSVQLRPFTTGRVGRWKLDEGTGSTAGDSAGLVGDDAVLGAGDPIWSWGRPGSGALAFLGAGLADLSPSLDLDVSDPGVSIAAWLYLETPPSALPEAFASVLDAIEDNYVLYLDRAAAELRFKVTLANGASTRPGIAEADLPLRQWIHVAGTYAGDGSARIYLDGVERDLHTAASLIGPVRSVPAQVAAFGRNGVGDAYYFDGRIDEIEVWRRGLSPEEIEILRGRFLFGDGFERGDTLSWSQGFGAAASRF
jgi:hypothetical protein